MVVGAVDDGAAVGVARGEGVGVAGGVAGGAVGGNGEVERGTDGVDAGTGSAITVGPGSGAAVVQAVSVRARTIWATDRAPRTPSA